MSEAAPKPRENQGDPVRRIDGRLKVTGEARYPADIEVSNLAYGVLVTTDIARGKVTAVRVEAARAVPGVLDIVSYGEVAGGKLAPPKFGTGGSTSIQPLSDPKVWHDGQMVALVVADTFEAASEGAERVEVTYEREQASAGFDDPGTETIDAKGANEQFTEDPRVGDFEAAFAAAPTKIDASYSTPTQHHNPIELFSTTAAWRDDELTIYEPSQFVAGWQNNVAEQLHIDPSKARVISPYIGGGFGSKGPMTPRTAVVAFAAKRLNRPIRCVVSRMQGFTTATYRAETRHHIRMGARPDGRITAFSHEGWEVTSRPDNYVVGGTDTTTRMYGYGTVYSKVKLVKADRNTPGYMRSPPETPYVYALENAMDEMAVALNMDPVEFRRVNDTMEEPIGGKAYTSRSLMKCFDEASAAFRWADRDPEVGSMRDGDWLVGLGCASVIYPTNVAPCTARVRLTPEGKVRVQTAGHEIGTGVRTVAAQMAAERLGVEVSAVEVEMGDSALPPAPVAGGSNSTASICSAIIKACEAVRNTLFHAAVMAKDGPFAGLDPLSLDLHNGAVVGPNGQADPLASAFKRAESGVIEEYAEFAPKGAKEGAVAQLYKGQPGLQGGSKGEKMMYAFGAEFVEVRINARTREIRVPRIVGAFAAGRIMNTRTARSQLMGGMIWGISSALHEATEIDRRAARYVNRDLQDYLVPVNADIRQLDVIMVPETDTEVNPAGVKGLGELGNVGTAAAIASAVHHATGKRIRDLPIRIDKLFA